MKSKGCSTRNTDPDTECKAHDLMHLYLSQVSLSPIESSPHCSMIASLRGQAARTSEAMGIIIGGSFVHVLGIGEVSIMKGIRNRRDCQSNVTRFCEGQSQCSLIPRYQILLSCSDMIFMMQHDAAWCSTNEWSELGFVLDQKLRSMLTKSHEEGRLINLSSKLNEIVRL